MEQVLFGGYHSLVSANSDRYNSLDGGYPWAGSDAEMATIVSTDGVIKYLRVKLSAPPGVGKHFDFTLILNGNPTALTLEIAGNDTTGNNMVNEINVAPGDTVSLLCDPDNSPATSYVTWTTVFEGDTSAESIILAKSPESLSTSATEYGQPKCSYTEWSNIENNFRQVVPTAGTLKNFYVEMSLDAGLGNAYRFTVRLNGATVAQSLIVTIATPAKTGSDLVHNLVVIAGDVLTLMVEPIDGPTKSPKVMWGMTFVADTDGESIVLGGSLDDLNNAATEYHLLTASEATAGDLKWGAEANRYQMGQDCTIKKLYILLSAAPGVGNTYTFSLNIVGDSNDVVVVVTGAATTGNSAALTDAVANDDIVTLKVVPDDTPDVADAYWGFVCYIAPPAAGWTGTISGVTNPAEIVGVPVANIAEVKGVA